MSTSLLLVAVATGWICGAAPIDVEPRIVNGVPTSAELHSFIADLRYYFDPSYYYYYYYNLSGSDNVTLELSASFCTGSLYQLEYPATIITAAHCLYGQNGTICCGATRTPTSRATTTTRSTRCRGRGSTRTTTR